MLKPRIKYAGLPFLPAGMGGSVDGTWACSGFRHTGYGATPFCAYQDWKRARKRNKGLGISSARFRRQAAEKRVQDREQRRRDAAINKRVGESLAAAANCIKPGAAYKDNRPLWERILW